MAEDVFGIVGSTQAGSFLVERPVAEGAFGVVYRAQHGAFRAPVALKCLKVPTNMTAEQRAAFLETFREEGEDRRGVQPGHAHLPGRRRILRRHRADARPHQLHRRRARRGAERVWFFSARAPAKGEAKRPIAAMGPAMTAGGAGGRLQEGW